MKKSSFNIINYFRPNLFVDKIENININIFKNKELKAVLCDLDNTLVPHFTRYPTRTAFEFCKQIKDLGLKFIIVSNNTKKRVKTFANMIQADDFVARAAKPFTFKTRRLLKKNNLDPNEVIFIGDQFIFDIFTANRLQCKSILTLPIMSNSSNEQRNWFFKFIEEKIYNKLQYNSINENRLIEMEQEDEIL